MLSGVATKRYPGLTDGEVAGGVLAIQGNLGSNQLDRQVITFVATVVCFYEQRVNFGKANC